MALTVIIIFLTVAVGAWGVCTNFFISEKKNADILKWVAVGISAAGALGLIFCVLHFYISVSAYDRASDAVQLVKDNFVAYTSVECIVMGIGILLCLVSAILKNKMSNLVWVIMPLWAVIGLFWTLLMASLSGSTWINIGAYINLFGYSVAALCALPIIPVAFARARELSDTSLSEAKRMQREKKRAERKAKIEHRRRIREKQKKLKHPNK